MNNWDYHDENNDRAVTALCAPLNDINRRLFSIVTWYNNSAANQPVLFIQKHNQWQVVLRNAKQQFRAEDRYIGQQRAILTLLNTWIYQDYSLR